MGSTGKLRLDITRWTYEDVAVWMRENDFHAYVELFTTKHKIDGVALLSISETDLRSPPLQLSALGDIKRISMALAKLRCRSGEFSAVKALEQNGFFSNLQSIAALPNNVESVNFHAESPATEKKSLIKTLLALFYCCLSLLLTSFVMVIVHDRVPDMKMYPPLPDIFLDNVPLISWAFEVCELLACILAAILLAVIIFHKHRLILMRRMFSLTGTVFLLRCITMMITSLSVPGVHFECTSKSYGDIYAKLWQALRIWYGMGMSLRGVRTCGDYMFSGHTTAVTLLNHFITEYTPDDWKNLHTASWVMNLFSIFFILAGHEHYSIDVFVAFYISSRLFCYYHSMAYHASSMADADSRMRGWFPLFWFFESGGQLGRVPNEYAVPFWPTIQRWWTERCQNKDEPSISGDSSTFRFQLGGETFFATDGQQNGKKHEEKHHSSHRLNNGKKPKIKSR